MKIYAYDIEVFENLFTVTFVDVDDKDSAPIVYYIWDNGDNTDLSGFLENEMILVGYNNHSFDDPLLRFIMDYHGEKLTSDAFHLSSKLMDDNYRMDNSLRELRYPKKNMYAWNSIDLMEIMGFNNLGISLKQTAINLKWHKIQDIPISPFSHVKKEQLKLVLDYNLNDVLITKRLYEEIEPIRQLRIDLSKLYNINLTSASDSKMANLILENIYSNELKTDIRALRTMRTNREKLLLGECMAKFVNFQSPELKEMRDRVSSKYVYDFEKFKYEETINFANCNFTIGVGGLHTNDPAGIYESDNDYLIQDMDVASYYPNLIINNNFYPEHLGPQFIQVLKKITAERLQAKKDGNKVKADGLKITVNSIFGKTSSPHFWLYDPKQFISTTITGQMGLLMLVEGMHLNDIEVLSCNTDGIVCRIPRKHMDKYYNVAHAWEKVTGLELEFTPYRKYIRRDVNSYITIKEDGYTKEKGIFVKNIDLKKGYHMPIVAKSLYAYFVENKPIHETINECKDIMDFCISQKTANNFSMELHTGNSIQKLQKTNRFYVTNKGGLLIKRSTSSNRTIGLYVGNMVSILNDFDPTMSFEKYDVDLSFYEKEVMKIFDEIIPRQLRLFDLSYSESGKIIKQNVVVKKTEEKEINSVYELKKLGKNQLIKRVENIISNNQSIAGVSPRYAYVEDFRIKSMTASIYCLAKGVRSDILIDKRAYKKQKIETGQLIYCNKFLKTERGHAIMEYKVVENLEPVTQSII